MRQLLSHEIPLLQHLCEEAGIDVDLAQMLVKPLDDGGMGSLLLNPTDVVRHFGCEAACCEFNDSDGVLVSATLNLDKDLQLFELDVWKVDFSPVSRWPTTHELQK